MRRRGGIAYDAGGAGRPLLVLLHGLGATAGVWTALVEGMTRRWIAPDLPGHGASDDAGDYSVDAYAAALRAFISAEAAGGAVTILGHSLGGTVALTLAGSDLPVEAVFGLGIKVDWTDDELARFAGLAERPAKLFETEQDALAQHRRNCGLGDTPLDSPLLTRGVRQDGDRWSAAMDMRAFAVDRPRMVELVAAARSPVRLGCGEGDAMISARRLRAFDPQAVAFAEAGHNAMVDTPDTVRAWLG